MEFQLLPNPEAARPGVVAHLTVDLAGSVAAGARSLRIPVHADGAAATPFNAELCGFRVEAAAPEGLRRPAARVLRGLKNAARLPTYVFVARRSRRQYPVYTIGDEVMATTPGGPVFRHVELAKVRDYLTAYLHAVGELGTPGRSDTLHVRGVAAECLSLVRPCFYLKKRPGLAEENEFWAPVFPAADGQGIYAYAASRKWEVAMAGGQEVLQLRDRVAAGLTTAGRLRENCDLRVDRLFPEHWQSLRDILEPTPVGLMTRAREFPVFRHHDVLVAAEARRGEDRISLYLGAGPADLRRRMAVNLVRRGVLQHESGLRSAGTDA